MSSLSEEVQRRFLGVHTFQAAPPPKTSAAPKRRFKRQRTHRRQKTRRAKPRQRRGGRKRRGDKRGRSEGESVMTCDAHTAHHASPDWGAEQFRAMGGAERNDWQVFTKSVAMVEEVGGRVWPKMMTFLCRLDQVGG
ncbi:hypothetical protein ACOMHN_040076 [Nucella lapillus]